ncbi:hypothetical protein Taro_007893 [Colocasia esculenta]|uniref:Uncharacterized protein n=1 Tax=Colocasia esculenta TaxID=4460 RepID=A0A843TSE3_COLES|nr:hypothetical protein [Colocasia esculenta]
MWCVPLCLHGLWFGIPCEALARSREADSDQIRYWFNGLGRGVPSHNTSWEAHLNHVSSLASSVGTNKRPCTLLERLIFMRPAHPYPHWGGYVEAHVRTGYRLPSSLSGGPFGSDPNKKTPPHLGAVCGNDINHDSRTFLFLEPRQQGDEISTVVCGLTRQSPPVDVAVATSGAAGDVPATAVPATALEIAELWGQMHHLVGIYQGLQAQLAIQPALTVPPPPEQQAELSRRRSRTPQAP